MQRDDDELRDLLRWVASHHRPDRAAACTCGWCPPLEERDFNRHLADEMLAVIRESA